MIVALAKLPGRSVAQLGSASAWGAEGREFESHRSDQPSPHRRARASGHITDEEGHGMNAPNPALEPWQWPEGEWRRRVDRVRAGRKLRPAEWPGGARCAVTLSFDSDHETSDLRDGGNSIGRLAWGQYGNRVGVPRILKVLEKYRVKASFYVPAVTALLHPDEQRQVVAEGHEIGIHGWIHELNSVLPHEAERDLMLRSADALEKVSGVRPVGLRTPSWDFSRHTLEIEKEMGLAYDSSLMADEDCYELLLDGAPTGVVELPVEWVRDDAVYFMMNRFSALRPYTPPTDVFDIFRREFDAAHAEGGIFQLTMHPHVIGYRSRIWILEEIIRHAQEHKDVWFATHAEVVDWAKRHAA
jgi:peptidoglycan-N-acetylglucosamine deacetylase